MGVRASIQRAVMRGMENALTPIGFQRRSKKLQRGDRGWATCVELSSARWLEPAEVVFDVAVEFEFLNLVESEAGEPAGWRFSQALCNTGTSFYDLTATQPEAAVSHVLDDFSDTTLTLIESIQSAAQLAGQMLQDELAPGVRNYMNRFERAVAAYDVATACSATLIQARAVQELRSFATASDEARELVEGAWEILEIPGQL